MKNETLQKNILRESTIRQKLLALKLDDFFSISICSAQRLSRTNKGLNALESPGQVSTRQKHRRSPEYAYLTVAGSHGLVRVLRSLRRSNQFFHDSSVVHMDWVTLKGISLVKIWKNYISLHEVKFEIGHTKIHEIRENSDIHEWAWNPVLEKSWLSALLSLKLTW